MLILWILGYLLAGFITAVFAAAHEDSLHKTALVFWLWWVFLLYLLFIAPARGIRNLTQKLSSR